MMAQPDSPAARSPRGRFLPALPGLRGRGLLTPYARATLAEGADQAWHVGTQLALRESLSLSLEAVRRQREGEAAAHELALHGSIRW